MVECQFKTVTLKTDITDNFPIAIALRTDEPVHESQKVQNVHKLTSMKRPSNHLNNGFEKLTG